MKKTSSGCSIVCIVPEFFGFWAACVRRDLIPNYFFRFELENRLGVVIIEEKPLDTAEKADPDKHKEDNEGSFPLYVLNKDGEAVEYSRPRYKLVLRLRCRLVEKLIASEIN